MGPCSKLQLQSFENEKIQGFGIYCFRLCLLVFIKRNLWYFQRQINWIKQISFFLLLLLLFTFFRGEGLACGFCTEIVFTSQSWNFISCFKSVELFIKIPKTFVLQSISFFKVMRVFKSWLNLIYCIKQL